MLGVRRAGDGDRLQRPPVRGHLVLAAVAGHGDLDRARALYHKLPPWQAWQPPRFVALVVLDLRARAAALLGDADGAAIAYARLRPWARYFVVGGTGSWRSTAPPTCCTSPSAPRENQFQHILTKLGFHSRSQIAAWAARTIPDGTAGR